MPADPIELARIRELSHEYHNDGMHTTGMLLDDLGDEIERLRAELAAMTAAAVRLHAGRIATVHQQWLKPDAHEPGNRYTPMTEAEIGAMEIVVTALDALEAGDAG